MAPRLQAVAKVERDGQIVAGRARGLTTATLARSHGLSQGHVREILAERRREQMRIASFDPAEAVMEALDQYEDRIEALALLAASARHEAVQLGAIKAQLAAMNQRFALMLAVGLLPYDLDIVRHDLDMRSVIDITAEFLRKHQIPREDIEELIAEMEGSSGLPRTEAAA